MPIRSIDDLRTQAGADWADAPDADLISAYAKKLQADPALVAHELGYDLGSGGKNAKRLSSSIDRYQAGLYGVGEEIAKGVGAESVAGWLGKQRKENELQADVADIRARNMGAIQSWEDVKGVGDFGDYAVGLGIQSLPYMAEALTGGIAGRAVMGGTKAALRTAEAAGDLAGAAKAKRALNIGSGAGAAGASYPSAVGDILSNQREQTGGEQTDLASAAALGVPYALANVVGVEGALARGGLFRNTINLLDKPGGLTGAAVRATATGAATGLKEGASETFQEMLNQGGRMAVDPVAELFDEEAQKRYKESFIGGAILGGGTSALLGGWRRSGNEIQQAFDTTQQGTTPTNTSNLPPPPPSAAPPVAPPASNVPGTSAVVQATQANTATSAAADQASAQQDALAQQKLQEQASREQTFQTLGATLTPDNGGTLSVFGQSVFGPQIETFGNALAGKVNALNDVQRQIVQAMAQANAETGGKLVNFTYNGNNPVGSANQALKSLVKAFEGLQIGHVQTVDEAAAILNKLSESAKGTKLEQINAVHSALTGEDTVGYIASQQAPTKGAKNGQQVRVQNDAGLRNVREQGAAGEAGGGNAGAVQPGGIQPQQPGGLPEGSLGLQTGQLPGEGIRTGTGGSTAVAGDALSQAPQVTQGGENGQSTTTTTQTSAAQAGTAIADTSESGTAAAAGTISASDGTEQEVDTPTVEKLIRAVLRTVFKSDKKVEFFASFAGRANKDVSDEELAKRYGLSVSSVRNYKRDLDIDKATGLPKFIAANLEKFQQALKLQAELLNVDVQELRSALQSLVETETETDLIDESDLIASGLAIQNAKERTTAEGEGTGKIDRTNVTNLNEEGNTAEVLSNQYLEVMDALEAAEGADDQIKVSELQAKKAELETKIAKEVERAANQTRAKAGQVVREKQTEITGDLSTADRDQVREEDNPLESDNAVQEQSAGEMDVREQAGDGETVGEGNLQPQKPAGKGERKAKSEPKTKQGAPAQKQVDLRPDDVRAGEAWDAVASEYPNAPKWADLTKDQRETFVDFGEENWTPDDVRGELVKLARTGVAKQAKVTMKAAAFRSRKTGEVIETGPVHNRYKLPGAHKSDLQEWEAGFVGTNGQFYNREEAAQAIGSNKKTLRTEDFDAIKGLQAPRSPVTNQGVVTLYHGTSATGLSANTLNMPTRTGQLGVHFGDQSTAAARNEQNVVEADVNLGNVLRMPDLNIWSAATVVPELKKLLTDGRSQALISQFETNNPSLLVRGATFDDTKVRQLLTSLGIDTIVYENKFEGKGTDSYIVLNKTNINRASAPTPAITDESNIIDVEARVVDETVGPQVAALPAPQVQRLEKHYGLKSDSPEFLTKVKEDVVRFATKGAEAVSAAIRDIIKSIHAGLLSVAMIFNPINITPVESLVVIPKAEAKVEAKAEQVQLAKVPAGAESMSPAGQQAYATLIPALKGKNGDKLITIADKPSGQIFVFDADGNLIVKQKALFGLAKGDLYVGNNDLPQNRVTPAGLFGLKLVDAAKGGSAAKTAGDYDFGKVFALEDPDAVVTIMHSVWLRESDASQRAAALKNDNPADSRYSFGCINVDKATYKMLLDKYQAQMDGSKLFVVPDDQTKVKDFLEGNVPNDKLVREGVKVAGVQQSRSKQRGQRYTAEQLTDDLTDFVNRDSLGKSVLVVDELEDLRSLPEFAGMNDQQFQDFLDKNDIDARTQAFISNATGRAYMLASNVQVGQGRAVFMHEVGGHLGVQKYLSRELFNRLASKIADWAKKDDGSVESSLARAAAMRVIEAKQAMGPSRYTELVAYFLEEAVNAGIDPTNVDSIKSAGLREWLRSMWAAFKNAVRRLRGVNVDKLTAQDVVDMAYGYAQLEIAANYHGSNASFRQFSVSKMSTGAGNQQYGWGLYFAQRRKTAEGYAEPVPGSEKGTLSHLYTVDLAIRDDQFLYWNKPISDQSLVLQKLATKLGMPQTARGEEVYEELADQLFKTAYNKEITTKKERSIAHKAASQTLDQLGIKGLQYRDANDSSRESNNIVVFNPKNIVRIQTETGTVIPSDDIDPQYNWASVQQSRASIETLPPKLQASASATWKTLFKNVALPLMMTEDLLKAATKFMRSTPKYLDAQMKRMAKRLEIEGTVDLIIERFEKLPADVQKMVNEYIYDSTMQQKWGYYPGEHRVGTTLFEVDPDFEKRFDAIAARSKEAASIIEDTFEHGYQMLRAKQAAVDAAIDREFADRERAALGDPQILQELAKEKKALKDRELRLRNIQIDKPYAYLARYGDYIVVAKSKEFKHFEERAKLNDFDVEQAKGWLAENVSNPDHYVVQFAETQGEADQIAADLMATGKYDIQPDDAGPKEANGSYSGGDAFVAVKRLMNLADRRGEDDPNVRRLLSDLYLATVAESSARKSELQRKYVSGADKNMMRNLATSGRADAHFLSTIMYNDEVLDSLEAMRGEASRNRRDSMPYYNEVYARYSKGLDYKTPGPIVQGLTRMSTIWNLSLNPAYYLQQLLQTAVLSLPFMSGRLGYFRSAREIRRAYGDMARVVKGLSVNEHVNFDSAAVPADVKEMLRTLVGMGKIDVGIESESRALAGEQGITAKVMRKLQGVNNRVETINRATAAIAAYRGYLARYGQGKKDAATKYAAEVVSNTHGSYDGFNTPRVLDNAAGRVIGQFKRFQIIQLSMLAKLIHNSFKGASPEEKAVARRSLAFITSHMAVLGGALGIPFVSQIGAILLAAIPGDDPDDLETVLRRAIGDDTVADLLLRGVPAALGLESLGKKLAMENVASLTPFVDFDLTSRSGLEKTIIGLMGPSVSLGLKMADGIDLMSQGLYYKGLEQMLPNGMANLLRGARLATEGVTMRNGDTVMGPQEITMLDAAFQAVGLPTSTITDRQRIQRVVTQTNQFYQDAAKEIKADYTRAFKDGDSDAMSEAREAWMELQDSRSARGYTREPLSALFRAPMEQQKRERNVVSGVEFNKGNRRFVESLQ